TNCVKTFLCVPMSSNAIGSRHRDKFKRNCSNASLEISSLSGSDACNSTSDSRVSVVGSGSSSGSGSTGTGGFSVLNFWLNRCTSELKKVGLAPSSTGRVAGRKCPVKGTKGGSGSTGSGKTCQPRPRNSHRWNCSVNCSSSRDMARQAAGGGCDGCTDVDLYNSPRIGLY